MGEPRQAYMKLLGEEGCYFLCIVHLAEQLTNERIDAIAALLEALDRGFIKSDCTVLFAEDILRSLTGIIWIKTHEESSYQVKGGQLEILRYERKTGAGTMVHFVVGDGNGEIEYDPLGSSRTVREGYLAGKRIFTRA